MSTETKLRAAMADAVAPVHPDTDRLVATARRQGLGIRRRRQALGTLGVAAAIGLAVLAPNVVAGDHGAEPGPAATTTTARTAETLDLQDTSPFTGRATAAALMYATLQAAPDGLAGQFAWEDPSPGPTGETYARFQLHVGSEKPGEVGINVQPGFTGDAAHDVSTCSSWMRACVVDPRPDGSVLVTYEEPSTYGSGGYRRVASLLRADDVRVVASASNGIDVTERDEQVTREAPPLTMAQLVGIVEQPWWGPELPTYFVHSGAELHGDSISGTVDGGPVAKPSS